MEIEIKRVYDKPLREDGVRLLVDRLWPRGIKKEKLRLDAWIKDIAPSAELRKWFNHDLLRFKEFKKKYAEELKKNKSLWKPQIDQYSNQKVTLLYSAKDPCLNQAVFLKSYLKKIYN